MIIFLKSMRYWCRVQIPCICKALTCHWYYLITKAFNRFLLWDLSAASIVLFLVWIKVRSFKMAVRIVSKACELSACNGFKLEKYVEFVRIIWFCFRKIQTALNKRWHRTLPCVRRENLEAVINAGKLSWNTMYYRWRTAEHAKAFSALDWLYSFRHGVNTRYSIVSGGLLRNIPGVTWFFNIHTSLLTSVFMSSPKRSTDSCCEIFQRLLFFDLISRSKSGHFKKWPVDLFLRLTGCKHAIGFQWFKNSLISYCAGFFHNCNLSNYFAQ